MRAQALRRPPCAEEVWSSALPPSARTGPGLPGPPRHWERRGAAGRPVFPAPPQPSGRRFSPHLAAPASDSGRPPLSEAITRERRGSSALGRGVGGVDGAMDSHSASDGSRSSPCSRDWPTDRSRDGARASRCHLAAGPSPGSDVRAAGTRTPKTASPKGTTPAGAPPKCPMRPSAAGWCTSTRQPGV